MNTARIIAGFAPPLGLPQAAAAFPVVTDVAAWRLMENWGVGLADSERKTRIGFAAEPESDGIFTILKRLQ